MKTMSFQPTIFLALAVAGALLAGCAQQQQKGTYTPAPTKAAEPAPTRGYGPSYATVEEGGARYTKGSMAFPSGVLGSSGLLVEKMVPVEVLVGQPFEIQYRVSNLTDYPIHMVTLTDQVSANFKTADATPKPAQANGGLATWQLDSLAARETKTIVVRGSSAEEGTITSCCWASYSPILCENIKVVKAAIQLNKRAPAEVIICDPIPMTLTVKNAGSSPLTNVKVTDKLPAGLTSDGKSELTFDAGTLAPGQTRDFTFNAAATKPGKYVNNAKATTAQGISAEATSTTAVLQPVLAISCKAPEERYIGRPFDITVTVVNKGDAPAVGVTLQGQPPEGVTFLDAIGGVSVTDRVVNLGTIPPGGTKEIVASFVSASAGTFSIGAVTKGACAAPVTTACTVRVVGIPAILLEVVDLVDPIEVGKEETYVVEVTNQGSAPATNVKIICTLEGSQTYVSASGASAASGAGQVITMAPVASIAPKAKAVWRVVVKANKAENVRFKVSMTSDQLTRPVEETESTNQY